MSIHRIFTALALVTGLFAAGVSASPPPETAQDILARSIQAHGGGQADGLEDDGRRGHD